jgi:superfamily I DNA/RNA helicase
LSSNKDEGEEKNLFFVCLTRAKKQIFITYSENDKDGKDLIASSFINEIKDEYKESCSPEISEQFKNERLNFVEKQNKNYNIQDKDLIKEIFTKNGLSVTAFNNYLECP